MIQFNLIKVNDLISYPAMMCNSCVLQAWDLIYIARKLRADFLSLSRQRKDKFPPPPIPWPHEEYIFSSSNEPQVDCPLCKLWSAAFPSKTLDGTMDVITFEDHWRSHDRENQDFDDVSVGPRGPKSVIFISDKKAKSRRYHDATCKQESGPPEIQGLKVIDCKRRLVVKAPVGATHYPTESQLGENWEPETANDIKLLPTSLPRIISDALEATLALGYRYLWVDQFCINQSDSAEVADQVGKMDQIYRGADLTIVAASSKNGLLGTPETPREDNQIVMTSYKAICEIELIADGQELEAKSQVHQIPSPEDFHAPGLEINPNSFFDRCLARDRPDWMSSARFNIMAIRQIIAEFTKRRLSFDENSLNAVLGVLAVFRGMEPSVYCCQGLPVSQQPDGRIEDNLLLESLFWYHNDPASARRREQFPSWSWAGWSGSIVWKHLPGQCSANRDAKVLALAGGCNYGKYLHYQ
ncbi:heterokaryon incompatibility protein-domain-containing protein [Podospora fimiseda]|uniref:Heterokaryon incompatibility protein-domain-containing protein n=1 Tax=Podospora fimiseda TaxID=252190 RepID=A0AAN6YLT4_9PEZI|nr:heterokaryon incompatibility protein-domain-containing protein [Podospora fimiseda]